MKTNALAILTVLCLGLVPSASSADPLPDLGLTEHRYLFAFSTQETPDLVSFHMDPNTKYNPLLIPCDVEWLSVGTDLITYKSESGPPVSPLLEMTFWEESGQYHDLHGSSGWTLPALYIRGWLGTLDPQEDIGIGMCIIDTITILSTNHGQPSDFPPDQLIRLNLNLVGYTNENHTTAYGDADPSDNSANFWFKRQCSCEQQAQ